MPFSLSSSLVHDTISSNSQARDMICSHGRVWTHVRDAPRLRGELSGVIQKSFVRGLHEPWHEAGRSEGRAGNFSSHLHQLTTSESSAKNSATRPTSMGERRCAVFVLCFVPGRGAVVCCARPSCVVRGAPLNHARQARGTIYCETKKGAHCTWTNDLFVQSPRLPHGLTT